MQARRRTRIALLAAVLCIAGPLTLPIGPVPVSLTTALLLLTALLLGPGDAALCCGVYLLLGTLGLPVFSGFTGGVGQLVGPTGGFLLGYLPMTALAGCVCQRTSSGFLRVAGFAAATLALYAAGTAWYCASAGVSVRGALTVCVLPFLPVDAAKVLGAAFLGGGLQRRLRKAGLI